MVPSRRHIAIAALATALVVGVRGTLAAQSGAFSRQEKPFETISKMFLKRPVADSLVQLTRAQLGTRYKLGAKAPGQAFDCSGLVQWVMARFDLDVPRTSREQAKVGMEIPKDPTQLKPGDLLYFGKGKKVDHIGIYVGDGKYVHAANKRKGVIEAMLPTGKLATRWWKGVRRLFDVQDDSTLVPATDTATGTAVKSVS